LGGVDLHSTLKLPEYPNRSPQIRFDARTSMRKAESDRPLVETLLAGAKAKPPVRRHAKSDVHGQVLMRSKVVYDAAAIFARTVAMESCATARMSASTTVDSGVRPVSA